MFALLQRIKIYIEDFFSRVFRGTNIVYAIFTAEMSFDNNEPLSLLASPPVTVVTSRKEAFLAVNRLLYFQYHDHYVLWCQTRDLPVGFATPSWKRYAEESSVATDMYRIVRIRCPRGKLASLFRAVMGQEPLYLEYEFYDEVIRYQLLHIDPVARMVVSSPRSSEMCHADPDYARMLDATMVQAELLYRSTHRLPIQEEEEKEEEKKED